MEGPAGGDHLALRDVVKYDFSTRLFWFDNKKEKNVAVAVENSARPHHIYTWS